MVKKTGWTKTEAEYKRLERVSKIWLFFVLLLIIACVVLLVAAKIDECKLLLGVLLLIEIVFIVWISSYIVKKRNKYLKLIIEERNAIVRTGIFKEIYEEYRHNGFEFNLVYDKLLHEEFYNNSIDIALRKNHHEFLIEIDERVISIMVDEETDSSIEMELQLADFSTMEQVYLVINEFINMHAWFSVCPPFLKKHTP